MGRANLEQTLAKAEQRVTRYELHIARQREHIAELERNGHDANQAINLLDHLLATQASLVEDCDRIMEMIKISN